MAKIKIKQTTPMNINRNFDKDFDINLPSEEFVFQMFEKIFSRSPTTKEIAFHKERKSNTSLLHEFLQCVEALHILKGKLKSKSPKKNSIALQVNGHFRSFEVRRNMWKDFVEKNPNVDIFIHTWSTTGSRSKERWIDESESAIVDSKDIAETLMPKSMLVENNDSLLDHFSVSKMFPGVSPYMNRGVSPFLAKDDFTKFIMSQLYSAKAVNQLRNQYQNLTKKKYDIVFRLRADAFPSMDMSILDEVDISNNMIFANMRGQRFPNNPLSGCSACNYEYPKRIHGSHSNYMSDIFYYCKPKTMDLASGIYDKVGDILDEFQEHNSKMDMDGHRIHQANHNIKIVINDSVSELTYRCFYPEVLLSHTFKNHWSFTDLSRCKIILNTAAKVK